MSRFVDLCLIALVPAASFMIVDIGTARMSADSCGLIDLCAIESRSEALTKVIDTWKRYVASRDRVLEELEAGNIDFRTACDRLVLQAEDLHPNFLHRRGHPGERPTLLVAVGLNLIEQSRFYRAKKEGYVGSGNLAEWEAVLATFAR
jgi:hypothetical protein